MNQSESLIKICEELEHKPYDGTPHNSDSLHNRNDKNKSHDHPEHDNKNKDDKKDDHEDKSNWSSMANVDQQLGYDAVRGALGSRK